MCPQETRNQRLLFSPEICKPVKQLISSRTNNNYCIVSIHTGWANVFLELLLSSLEIFLQKVLCKDLWCFYDVVLRDSLSTHHENMTRWAFSIFHYLV